MDDHGVYGDGLEHVKFEKKQKTQLCLSIQNVGHFFFNNMLTFTFILSFSQFFLAEAGMNNNINNNSNISQFNQLNASDNQLKEFAIKSAPVIKSNNNASSDIFFFNTIPAAITASDDSSVTISAVTNAITSTITSIDVSSITSVPTSSVTSVPAIGVTSVRTIAVTSVPADVVVRTSASATSVHSAEFLAERQQYRWTQRLRLEGVDAELTGHSIDSFNNVFVESLCAQLCIKDARCQSFNYYEKESRCLINDKSERVSSKLEVSHREKARPARSCHQKEK